MSKDIIGCVGLTGLIILIISNSQGAKAGATSGIELCLKIIIPSLLPILIITGSVIKSSCANVLDIAFGKMVTAIFKLPRHVTGAIIFGLIGGYPAGAILTDNLLTSNAIDEMTARRMLRFNFCGGVAFVITAIGTIKLNSTRAGIILFCCNIFASIIIGIIQGINQPKSESIAIRRKALNDAIIDSVEASTKSVLIMASYIILFSTIKGIVTLPSIIAPILEITSGIFGKDSFGISELAFYLGFGGICIHFQIYDIIKRANMKYIDFLAWRIICGGISYFLGKIACLIIPNEVSVFSNSSIEYASFGETSTLLSVILLVSCVVFVYDLKNRKSKLI